MDSESPPSLEGPADLSPLPERPADLRIQSKITDLILSFKSHERVSSPTYFLFMGGYRNLHTSGFFPVIYPRTKISVIISSAIIFSLPCETTLLMLSCDRIESAQFIHGAPLPAKLIYYNMPNSRRGSSHIIVHNAFVCDIVVLSKTCEICVFEPVYMMYGIFVWIIVHCNIGI